MTAPARDVIDEPDEAAALALPPLLIRQPLRRLLDTAGLGHGELHAQRIGEGLSNVTYLLQRDGFEAVLRRPPRPPHHSKAHDVLREARLLRALEPTGARVPKVLLTCKDTAVLGVPFYLMQRIAGDVLTDTLPEAFRNPDARRRIGEELVDGLAELHTIDWDRAGLGEFGKPTGFLERQLTIYSRVWESAPARRDLPLVEEIRDRLRATMPHTPVATLVHGDYRLGNVVYAPEATPRLAAILDWEVATIGDPLFDLGYFISSYPEPGDSDGLLLDFAGVVVTDGPGFPTREDLLTRYTTASGREPDDLGWYMALANWRTAVGLEIFYQRRLADRTDPDEQKRLEHGVPQLLERAWSTTSAPTTGSRTRAEFR